MIHLPGPNDLTAKEAVIWMGRPYPPHLYTPEVQDAIMSVICKTIGRIVAERAVLQSGS